MAKDNISERRKELEALLDQLKQVERAARGGKPTVREADAERKRAFRASYIDIKSRPPQNPERRAACEADCILWLTTYFPHDFTTAFTYHRREMALAIESAATYGGDQAIAAPRGEGKTTIAECVAIRLILKGQVRFPLIAAANGPDAERILRNIRERLEKPELARVLAEDYPEIDCILALDGKPQRANGQTVGGSRTFIRWTGSEIRFPTYPGAVSSGAAITTRGLDAAIRGVRIGNLRPDLVLIDDPETRESVDSALQTQKRELTIERDLAGLGGPGKRLSRVMLTTISRKVCLSAKYTDPVQRPSWRGRRFRFLIQWPERLDLWEEYITLRQAGQRSGDAFARRAHRFYLENRAEMDRGAEVSNPNRYVADICPDGSPLEVSALQFAFNVIADRGRAHFDTEMQNESSDEGEELAGLTRMALSGKLNGLPRSRVPLGFQHVTAYVDVHKRILFWLVAGWANDFTGAVIDYGTWPRQQREYFSQSDPPVGLDDVYAGTEESNIVAGLEACVESLLGATCYREDEAPMQIGRLLIDTQYKRDLVQAFCRRHEKSALLMPAVGGAIGARKRPFEEYRQEPGIGLHAITRLAGVNRHIWIDTYWWKTFVAGRLGMPLGAKGGIEVFGRESASHDLFFDHLTSEKWDEVTANGRTVKEWLLKPNRDNHWWDCLVGSAVAVSMLGVRPVGHEVGKTRRPPGERPSLADLAGRR